MGKRKHCLQQIPPSVPSLSSTVQEENSGSEEVADETAAEEFLFTELHKKVFAKNAHEAVKYAKRRVPRPLIKLVKLSSSIYHAKPAYLSRPTVCRHASSKSPKGPIHSHSMDPSKALTKPRHWSLFLVGRTLALL
jgi:hypothetical protein